MFANEIFKYRGNRTGEIKKKVFQAEYGMQAAHPGAPIIFDTQVHHVSLVV